MTLRFADGVVKRFGYNDLAFWEETSSNHVGTSLMCCDHVIAVVVPAYNEENLSGRVIGTILLAPLFERY